MHKKDNFNNIVMASCKCSKILFDSQILIDNLFFAMKYESNQISDQFQRYLSEELNQIKLPYFLGTVETYVMTTLSTKDPNPRRKLDVMFWKKK